MVHNIRKNRRARVIFTILITITVSSLFASDRKLVATHGNGYLETVDGYLVLHLKGDPNEMGEQHGILLKDHIQSNISFLLGQGLNDTVQVGSVTVPKRMVANLLITVFQDKVPPCYLDEMKSLARTGELPEWKIIAANLIPELFHCSGFALLKETTAEKKLYHGRILDYATDWHLQEHAVLMIVEPAGKIAFVNVSYAGFIGSVTGMNLKQISIGEMGGQGVGQWDGVPMSFLMRMVLDSTDGLDEAIAVFTDNKRTCEYYYVIADAKLNDAVGLKCVPENVDIIHAGQSHELLPNPVKNTVLVSAGERYEMLSQLVNDQYGTFTQDSAIRLMDRPVAMKHNLHNVLMVPEDGIICVANADPNGSPAWKQKYYEFNIMELMSSRPN
ncbi:MAG: C45 family autoproteolytic acyltransferase/hydrolase [Candidatus Thorarchaeota archaeon]|jgi:hypothetical protein